MSQAKKRLAVLTGGGDCPGLNAVIRAVVKTALNNGYEIFGIENGFNGLVTGRMGLMDYKDVSGILPRGGTILGTTNRDNPFKFAVEENGELVYYDKRAEVLANLEKHGIEALVVIGGDGSLNIAARLAKECGIKVVGYLKRSITTFRVQNVLLVLTQQWRWLQKLWIGSIQRQNPIIALWRWKLWDVMLAGSHCIPA